MTDKPKRTRRTNAELGRPPARTRIVTLRLDAETHALLVELAKRLDVKHTNLAALWLAGEIKRYAERMIDKLDEQETK